MDTEAPSTLLETAWGPMASQWQGDRQGQQLPGAEQLRDPSAGTAVAAASMGDTVQQRDRSVPCWLQLWELRVCCWGLGKGHGVAVRFAT